MEYTGSADPVRIASSSSTKRLAIRRPGECTGCGRELAVGEKAIWNSSSRTLTCLACSSPPPPRVSEAGASALREYNRRHAKRGQHARETLGGLGVLLARLIDEPQSTTAWRQGARGEIRTAGRLAKHLRDDGVLLLHDRRVPRHGNANIDHIAVGPGGVLVIDSETHGGKVRTDWVGGLFAPRRTVLLINGRDQSRLIDGVECQVGYVRDALGGSLGEIDVRGALGFPDPDGLPLLRSLSVRDIIIGGPKAMAKLARRPGPLKPEAIEHVWQLLGRAFPQA